MSTPLAELEKLWAQLRRGGGRGDRVARRDRLRASCAPEHRKQIGRTFNRSCAGSPGCPFKDTQCGFKLMRTDTARDAAGGAAGERLRLRRGAAHAGPRDAGSRSPRCRCTYIHDNDSRVNPLTGLAADGARRAAAGRRCDCARRRQAPTDHPTETPAGESPRRISAASACIGSASARSSQRRRELELGALGAPARGSGSSRASAIGAEQDRVEVGGDARLPAALGARRRASSPPGVAAPVVERHVALAPEPHVGGHGGHEQPARRDDAAQLAQRGPRRRPRARARRWRRRGRTSPSSNGSASTPACTHLAEPAPVAELDGALRPGRCPRAGPSAR